MLLINIEKASSLKRSPSRSWIVICEGFSKFTYRLTISINNLVFGTRFGFLVYKIDQDD